jgi:hypothetical protein
MSAADLLPWQGVIMFVVTLLVVAALLPVFLRRYGQVAAARSAVVTEEAYRDLVATTAKELARLADELGALKRSVAEVERLLREVDSS